MDGSGRDGFVFLHGDVGKPKARIFRTNTTPWGAKSTAPWAHDPRLTIVAKCASLRRRPNTRGTKLVTPRQQRPYSAVRATSIFFLWSINVRGKSRILISSRMRLCCGCCWWFVGCVRCPHACGEECCGNENRQTVCPRQTSLKRYPKACTEARRTKHNRWYHG